MTRRPPPPEIVAAAEQDHAAMRNSLAELIPTVRALLATHATEVEVLTDVWLTLLHHPTRIAALLGATAIVQLAKGPADLLHPHPPGHDPACDTSDGPGGRRRCCTASG